MLAQVVPDARGPTARAMHHHSSFDATDLVGGSEGSHPTDGQGRRRKRRQLRLGQAQEAVGVRTLAVAAAGHAGGERRLALPAEAREGRGARRVLAAGGAQPRRGNANSRDAAAQARKTAGRLRAGRPLGPRGAAGSAALIDLLTETGGALRMPAARSAFRTHARGAAGLGLEELANLGARGPLELLSAQHEREGRVPRVSRCRIGLAGCCPAGSTDLGPSERFSQLEVGARGQAGAEPFGPQGASLFDGEEEGGAAPAVRILGGRVGASGGPGVRVRGLEARPYALGGLGAVARGARIQDRHLLRVPVGNLRSVVVTACATDQRRSQEESQAPQGKGRPGP